MVHHTNANICAVSAKGVLSEIAVVYQVLAFDEGKFVVFRLSVSECILATSASGSPPQNSCYPCCDAQERPFVRWSTLHLKNHLSADCWALTPPAFEDPAAASSICCLEVSSIWLPSRYISTLRLLRGSWPLSLRDTIANPSILATWCRYLADSSIGTEKRDDECLRR